jgi:hypothetical protein
VVYWFVLRVKVRHLRVVSDLLNFFSSGVQVFFGFKFDSSFPPYFFAISSCNETDMNGVLNCHAMIFLGKSSFDKSFFDSWDVF